MLKNNCYFQKLLNLVSFVNSFTKLCETFVIMNVSICFITVLNFKNQIDKKLVKHKNPEMK